MAQPVDLTFADRDLANVYVSSRPVPPDTLISKIVDYVKEKRTTPLDVCVDVGCGSGQNTELYSRHFKHVLGLDVSHEQLDIARQNSQNTNVVYQYGLAEQLPIDDCSVELVTCCASVHWLKFDNFYKEMRRVLKPGGVLACYSYLGCTPLYGSVNLREIVIQLLSSLKYWEEHHQHLFTEYVNLPDCFPEPVIIPSAEGKFFVEDDVPLATILGYMASWSAFAKLRKMEGEEAAALFLAQAKQKLQEALGTNDETIVLKRRYDYFLKMWRKPSS